jgi:hypothetical protein
MAAEGEIEIGAPKRFKPNRRVHQDDPVTIGASQGGRRVRFGRGGVVETAHP